MPQIRVNVRTAVNKADIRRETRNGREVIIVPSATLPDNVVMNGGLYPADEIAKSYNSLERTPAPLGHPIINGQYLPARDVEAINAFHIGAFNENVRRENGRVLMDKVIDVEVAEGTERGRRVLEAINKGEPIHTSTGLMLEPEPVQNKEYKWIARNMEFDHDAILLDEPGAATPEQGVGMMVNAQGEKVEIEVQEVNLTEEELRGMAESMAWRLKHEQEQEAMSGLIDKIVGKLRDMFRNEKATGLSVNQDEDAEMPITEEQFNALSEQVQGLADAIGKQEPVAEAVANAVKPLQDELAALNAANKEREEADRAKAINAITEAGLLEEDDAKALPTKALNALAAKAVPGSAAAIAAGAPVTTNAADEFSTELPEG